MDALIDKIRRGDRRSLARAMSLADKAGQEAQALKDRLRRSTGNVPWWGFTGPPGVGKSTLIDTLLGMLRQRGCRVGVVAVDPTSPVSDGALLGDRVRMMRHAVDEEVFIRSLATHRREGGLSDATLHCARLLELAGYDPVLIETVGVGQNEVDVAGVTDICVVIVGAGYGDDIQLTKAGLLEIADILVVNKCDLPDANRLLNEVREQLVLSSSATSGQAVYSDLTKSPGGTPDRKQASPGCTPKGMAPEVVGIEAKSGKDVDHLLEKLLELDRAARQPQQRQRHKQTRVLSEIRHSAMLVCEQALEDRLVAPATKELIAGLERGELSLDQVVRELSVISCQLSVEREPPRSGGRRLRTDG
ncbi:MAG: methylmalonyl Co-A mutase-associated GTPase MeaB [Phycisphaerales bacterium]|nr:MAG: methylmalonyl Co-A mutase-associated GTPase MeaB [Phycisphaerales bacterium]